MNKEDIKYRALHLSNKNDLLVLINDIQKEEWKHCHPFSISQLNYYTYPRLNTTKFNSFEIPKKRGGVRVISCPCNRSYKRLLRCVLILLDSIYTPPQDVHGFLHGHSVVTNASAHLGNKFQLNIDLKDFFPSINRKRIIKTLMSAEYRFNDEVAFVIASLCCMRVVGSHRGITFVLPQGSPASPILTNMVCKKMDLQLMALVEKKNLVYTRYADDITFSSDTYEFSQRCWVFNQAKHIIYKNHFEINREKVRFNKPGSRLEVTGLIVGKESVNVPRKYITNIRELLYVWRQYGYQAAEAKYLRDSSNKFHCPDLDCAIQGKLNYLKMVKGEHDGVYQKLLHAYTNINTGTIAGRTWDNCMAEWEDYLKKLKESDKPGNQHLYNTLINHKGVGIGKLFGPLGIELTVEEYKRFKAEGRPLQDIQYWCQSGEDIHEMVRAGINNQHYSTDDYLSIRAPRKGYYKVVELEPVSQEELEWSVLKCYYNYKTPKAFLDEIVEINYKPFTNKVSIGPKHRKIKIGDIIHVKEDTVLINGDNYNSYRVVWKIIK